MRPSRPAPFAGRGGDVVPASATVPASGLVKPPMQLEQRRLAGAVRADEPEISPRCTVERHAVDGVRRRRSACVRPSTRRPEADPLPTGVALRSAADTALRAELRGGRGVALGRHGRRFGSASPSASADESRSRDGPDELGEAAGEVQDQEQPARAWWRPGPALSRGRNRGHADDVERADERAGQHADAAEHGHGDRRRCWPPTGKSLARCSRESVWP